MSEYPNNAFTDEIDELGYDMGLSDGQGLKSL